MMMCAYGAACRSSVCYFHLDEVRALVLLLWSCCCLFGCFLFVFSFMFCVSFEVVVGFDVLREQYDG